MSSILNKLPVENRLKVWYPLVEAQFDGEIPNIIKALHGEDVLYKEILGIFCATNTYPLRLENGLGFMDMSLSAIHTILKVKIVVE